MPNPKHRGNPNVHSSIFGLSETDRSRAKCTSTEYVDGCVEDDCPACDPNGYAWSGAKHKAGGVHV